jgi:predicted O-methyltransferase YrrM
MGLKRQARHVLQRVAQELLRATGELPGNVLTIASRPYRVDANHDCIPLDARAVMLSFGSHPRLDLVGLALRDAAENRPDPMFAGIEARRSETEGDAMTIAPGKHNRGTRTIKEDRRLLSAPALIGRFLHHLVRRLGAATVIELGTAHGISALYLAAAIRAVGRGRLYTIEGNPDRCRLARLNAEAVLGRSAPLTCLEGSFLEVLPGVLSKLAEPIDLVFEDGLHEPTGTLAEFEMVYPQVAPGGLIVLDDIYHQNGNSAAWLKIRGMTDIAATVEINGRVGIAVKA